jgi:hypothetical protein
MFSGARSVSGSLCTQRIYLISTLAQSMKAGTRLHKASKNASTDLVVCFREVQLVEVMYCFVVDVHFFMQQITKFKQRVDT